jgi:hypothetical protein
VKNHGDVPVAIVARPEGASFRLLADERWNPARFRWVGEKDPVPPATPEAVKVLQPGEAYRERLDLRRPKWFLLDASGAGAAEPVTWVQVAGMWNAQFRLEYVPPAKAERAELPHAELIRMNVLRSRAFNAGGGVD